MIEQRWARVFKAQRKCLIRLCWTVSRKSRVAHDLQTLILAFRIGESIFSIHDWRKTELSALSLIPSGSIAKIRGSHGKPIDTPPLGQGPIRKGHLP